jgi:phosphoribosylglycinamide formyltransferase-1
MTAPATRLPVVVLISGKGSNFRRIAELAAKGALPVEVRAVLSDRADAGGLEIARSMGIPAVALSPKGFADRASFDRALAAEIDRFSPGLVVLAGFMRILGPDFVDHYAGRMLNIHPSLLPKYRGLHTHRRALEARDEVHGASVHFVTRELDGGPVILQARVPVVPGDDEDSLARRVHSVEHRIYPECIDWFARGRLRLEDGAPWLDGKRLDEPVVIDASDRATA